MRYNETAVLVTGISEEIATFFIHHGIPRILIGDRGYHFLAQLLQDTWV